MTILESKESEMLKREIDDFNRKYDDFKNSFANAVKSTIGEEIRKMSVRNDEKKKNKPNKFITKLRKILKND